MKLFLFLSAIATAQAALKTDTTTEVCDATKCKSWYCAMWCDCFQQSVEDAGIYAQQGCVDEGDAACDCSNGEYGLIQTSYSGYYHDNRNSPVFKNPQLGIDGKPVSKLVTSVVLKDPGTKVTFNIEGTLFPEFDGKYCFKTSSDDASHVYFMDDDVLTDDLVVNNGGLHAMKTKGGCTTLKKGRRYPMVVQFGENYGHAGLTLEWKGPTTYLPGTTKTSTEEGKTGLMQDKFQGYYKDDRSFFQGVVPTNVKTVMRSKNLKLKDPGSHISFRQRGTFVAAATKYCFKTRSDDASHVDIDGVMVVDNGGLHSMRTREGCKSDFIVGERYDFEVFFGENWGHAGLTFWYKKAKGKWTQTLGSEFIAVYTGPREAESWYKDLGHTQFGTKLSTEFRSVAPPKTSGTGSKTKLAKAPHKSSDGWACETVTIGNSKKGWNNVGKNVYNTFASKTLNCPAVVNSDNWLGGHTWPDTFSVAQTDNGLVVTRTDHWKHKTWGMNLQFECCTDLPKQVPKQA